VFVLGWSSRKSKDAGAAYALMLNGRLHGSDTRGQAGLPHFLRISVACRRQAMDLCHGGHSAMHLFDFHKSSRLARALFLALAVQVPGAAAQHVSADVTGLWIDHTGQGAVEIAPCGDRICGRVVWLKNPNHKSKSGKLICGTQVLGDLHRQAKNEWESGWIYNPEDEERFSAALKLTNANTLQVTGYLGIKLLGETFIWKRSTGPLEPCAPGNRPT
jgi:uncharacterized protein (DUF2147 family)